MRTPELKHQRYKDGELVPKPLSKPLGLLYPPKPGENTGRDTRSWQERRDDFASYEKHLERRKQMYVLCRSYPCPETTPQSMSTQKIHKLT